MARKDETTSLNDAWFIDDEAPFVGKDATVAIRDIDMLLANDVDDALVKADGLHYSKVSLRGGRILATPPPESYADETGTVETVDPLADASDRLPESAYGRLHRRVEAEVAKLLEKLEHEFEHVRPHFAALPFSVTPTRILGSAGTLFLAFIVLGGVTGAAAGEPDANALPSQATSAITAPRIAAAPTGEEAEDVAEFTLEEVDAMGDEDRVAVNDGPRAERGRQDQPRRRARHRRHRRR